MDWRDNLLTEPEQLARVLRESKRIAVLGIKTEEDAQAPAYHVPEYLQQHGYEIVPVPVYYPEAKEILGEPVHRTVAEVRPGVDVVEVFRKPQDVPQHLDDLLAARPRVVWMQLGIRNDEVAEKLARAGIQVVQDHCMLQEHRRLIAK